MSERTGLCIYCGEMRQFSHEHVPNASLGKFNGARTLNDRICSSCNGSFKLLDEQFARSGYEAMWRQALGLTSEGTPDPFVRGSAGAGPLQILASDPTTGEEFMCSYEPASASFSPLRQIVVTTKNGRKEWFVDPRHLSSDTELALALRNLSIRPDQIQDMAVIGQDDADQTTLEELAGRILPKSLRTKVPADQPAVTHVVPFRGRATLTSRYLRAIAKMGFHYLLRYRADYRGDEPVFYKIRNFIQHGGEDPRRFVVATHNSPLAPEPGNSRHRHIFVAIRRPTGELQAFLRFFEGPGNNPLTFQVLLGTGLVAAEPFQTGHLLTYYEGGPRNGHAGELIAMHLAGQFIGP